MRFRVGPAALVLVAVLLCGSLAGCEGSGEVIQEPVEQERDQAASDLQQQFDELDAQSDDGSAGGDPTSDAGRGDVIPDRQVSVPSSAKSCGDGIFAGRVTSCPFARNVASVYRGDPQPTIEVYSPVTEISYTMTCVEGSLNVCRGGNDAIVYFP